MSNQNAKIDANYRKTLLGITDDALAELRNLLVDPITGRLKVSAVILDGMIGSLNGLTASSQTFATGTSGNDFNIVSSVSIHTFNFPSASASNRGLLTSTEWSTFNTAYGWGNHAGLYSLLSHNHSGVYEPADADLTAIAALGFTATAFLKKTAADTWALDTNTYLTGNQTITLSGDVSGSGATAITTAIGADKITEAMLKAVDTATDEDILTYEATTGDFEWHSSAELKTAMSLDNATLAASTITDNVLVRGDGGSRGVQASGITIDDSNNVSGISSLISPTIYGSSAANGDLTLEGTSHATKTTSYVILQPTSGNVGIGTTAPLELLALGTAGTTAGVLSLAGATSGKAIINVSVAAGTPTLTLPTVTGTIASAAAALTDNYLVRGDGGSSGLQTTGILVADTTNDVSGMGTLGCGAITSTGNLALSKAGTIQEEVTNSATTGSARHILGCGDGTTSSEYAYYTVKSLETTPQEWRFGMFGDKLFRINDSTAGTYPLSIVVATGALNVPNLAGTGSRTVVADANGYLSAPVSDERLKRNINPIEKEIAIKMLEDDNIYAVNYKWKDKSKGDDTELGFTSQMFEPYGIEGLTFEDKGIKGLNYEKLTAILWEQNKALLARIKILEKTNG